MGIVVETFIICDSGIAKSCHENFGVDDRSKTGKQQRVAMLGNGWVHHGHADYCPACYQILKESNFIKRKNR